MKKFKSILKVLGIAPVLTVCAGPLLAQGYGGPLTFQGLDHYSLHSAVGRAMGGVTIAVKQDVASMFQNPAILQSVEGIQISVGALQSSNDLKQEQLYAPVRYYPNLSLFLEGLTVQIPDPDPNLFGFTAQDSVQRPYDNITPDWSRSDNSSTPIQAHLALPLTTGKLKIVAGIGTVEHAGMDHYYQNNNVLSPAILSQRPLPTFRPTDDNPIEVDWSQSMRSREGSLRGYGIALAGLIEKYGLSFGLSGMFWKGETDDFEREVSRGKLTFFSNAFRADSVYGSITRTGTSDFSGQEFTISSMLTGRFVTAGVSLKLPGTIKREYSMQIETDSTGTPSVTSLQGEDELKLPLRGRVGLSVSPRQNLTFGLEYEFRPYESVRYSDQGSNETSPWLPASLFRVGAEYMIAPWLALRGGMRGEAEVYQSEGSYIVDEPVTFTVYSAGVGVSFSSAHLNVTYETSLMKYQDIWASAISRNSHRRHTVIAQLSYEIPWMR